MSDTSTSASGPRPRARRGLRIALIGSLAVNLLLIGVMAGGVMRFTHRPPPDGMQTDYRSLWRALPADARAELRDAARTRGFPGDRPARLSPDERRARAARANAQIIASLRADPFDADALAQVLNAERAAVALRLDAARQAFVERVAALNPEQRQVMASELERAWEGRLPER